MISHRKNAWMAPTLEFGQWNLFQKPDCAFIRKSDVLDIYHIIVSYSQSIRPVD